MVFPAPGVATARKSLGLVVKYFSIASLCQARNFAAVPQAARPGKAGERSATNYDRHSAHIRSIRAT